MLQFIFGKPQSGKSNFILNKIKELSRKGEDSVLIVPEQLSFNAERSVLKAAGDSVMLNTSILSFTRLYDEVGSKVGGICAELLSDADKIIFMNRAITNVSDSLKLWKKFAGSVSFAKSVLDAVGEFKINAVGPEDLRKAANGVKSKHLAQKLNEIAIIFEEYDLLVGEKFIDPADKLSKLYEKLQSYRFFENKTVFIDSFKGFTGSQFRILERIFAQAKDIYISFCDNKSVDKSFSIFTNVRDIAAKIEALAKSRAQDVAEPIILEESYGVHSSLLALEKLISGEESFDKSDSTNINICECETIFDEANFAARNIKRLIRTKGMRFKDFVIIARNADTYKEAVASACRMNGINCFFDDLKPLNVFPVAVASLSAIDALNLSTENILRFHKSGIDVLTIDEICELENFCYLWNIEGKDWLKEWEMNPEGLVSEGEIDTKKLERINKLRHIAIKPLLEFKTEFKGNAETMCRGLIDLFDACDFKAKMLDLHRKLAVSNDSFTADALKQSYSEFIKILESLVRCFGDKEIKISKFREALVLAINSVSFGVIPQTVDEVAFGSADRIRPSSPKIAFILGANLGVFPVLSENTGIFNVNERKNLIEGGINIADNAISACIDEEYLVYTSLCSASDEVYITYAKSSLSGSAKEPSVFIKKICDNLEVNFHYEPQNEMTEMSLPESESVAFAEYCRRRGVDDTAANAIRYALADTPYFEIIEKLSDLKEKSLISKENAKKLYGNKIYMSASRFDTYSRCPFSYFCRYGLKIKKLQPAEFDVMQRGTIVHYCLEHLIEENGDKLHTLTVEELHILTDRYINMYLDGISGYRSVENAHLRFLVSRISRSLKDVVCHVANELSQSDFKPVSCELKIGDGEETNVNFDFDGGKISLVGSIDRLDSFDGYLRVVDYKTGSKKFKLPDILCGLNMQMLIYLYAVTRGSGLEDTAAAGILYQPAKRDLNDNGMAMNGLLQGDEVLYNAMDKQGEGEFVPKLSLNKDGTISKRNASYIEKEGFTEIFNLIERLMKKTGEELLSGNIAVSPTDGRESPACKYCDFKTICGLEDAKIKRVPDLNNGEVIDIIRKGEENGI